MLLPPHDASTARGEVSLRLHDGAGDVSIGGLRERLLQLQLEFH
jgi:hypothetical protein